ncbi:MAG TPA: alpha/beta hydrolase [Smithellaceae bacterium]|nr:alpha/beta hydrolase [Smithellaceae bacterium]HRS89195.1 alpha/beta hydrolase [Smithellaceae bacterium]HRV26119.1 alpha/beta hydrolase [Smithellaceae bacterium]
MIKEERIFIRNGEFLIEALLHNTDSKTAAIICHPHPLMGGSMHNNVVEAACQGFAEKNIATLRFNFRGVGLSSGSYDEGRGEIQDVICVHRYLQEEGYADIFFVGYSFGAWVGAKVISATNQLFYRVIFISPPINHFDFDFFELKNKVNLIICGDADNFCDIADITETCGKIGAKLEIIKGTDHFYWGKEAEIEKIISSHIKNRQKIIQKKVDFEND